MQLFKGALAREGKEIKHKTSDEKKGFRLFIELYGRKFWNICQVGIIFLLLSIPTLIVTWFVSGLITSHIGNVLRPYLAHILMSIGAMAEEPGVLLAYQTTLDFIIRIIISLMVAALWGSGPVSAGYTYVLRNYAREEYAWPWSDFWEHTVSNIKQSIVVWIIDVVMLFLLIQAFLFYSTQGGPMGFLKYVIAFVFLAYTMMHFYIYQLMVTFRLKLKDIFKNAFLLVILSLPWNILALILTFVIHGFMPYLGMTITGLGGSMGYWTIYVLLALLVFQGLTGFIINFVANNTIKKYMLDRLETKDLEENEKSKGLM